MGAPNGGAGKMAVILKWIKLFAHLRTRPRCCAPIPVTSKISFKLIQALGCYHGHTHKHFFVIKRLNMLFLTTATTNQLNYLFIGTQ